MISFFSYRKSKDKDSQSLFNSWLNQIIQEESPDNSIVAINFGIFETKKGFQIYIAGFKNYEKDSDDWAVGFGDYSPQNRYLQLNNSEFKNLDWQGVQLKVVDLINHFTETELYSDSFLSKALVITTGFDDGELLRIK
jgi:hypothetical protein